MNKHEKEEAWDMIMGIAREAGFIHFAFAGVALLDMNEEKKEDECKEFKPAFYGFTGGMGENETMEEFVKRVNKEGEGR